MSCVAIGWQVSCIPVSVILERLESGFLLFETEQGLVRAELSFWQRLHLLWTFRHFRHLSAPLLSARERALVNALFRQNAGTVASSEVAGPVIGMIENFVPTAGGDAARVLGRSLVAEKLEVAGPVGAASGLGANRTGSSALLSFSFPRFRSSRLAMAAGVVSLVVIVAVTGRRIQESPSSEAGAQIQNQQVGVSVVQSSPEAAKATVSASNAFPGISGLNYVDPQKSAAGKVVAAAAVSATQKQHVLRDHPATLGSPSTSTATFAMAGAPSEIQASRAPLRVVYPIFPNVHGRSVVAMTALVDSTGAVRSVRVVSGKQELAAAAVRAVRQWHYSPYLNGGQPIATETNIVMSFIAGDAISMSFPRSLPSTR